MAISCCRAGCNPNNSRKALQGDGDVFDGAQIAVAVAGQLQFEPENEPEAAELYNDPETTIGHTRPAQVREC